jgi:hypothetical protein
LLPIIWQHKLMPLARQARGYLLCSDNVRMSSKVANSSTYFVAIGHEDVGKRPALARASKCEAL